MGRVKIKWSSNFAYAIGLIATDGCLSKDGRHVVFVSKDLEQIENYQRTLGISCSIGRKSRGGESERKYFVLQFGDVLFYKFLLSVGLTPAKSKIIGELEIPDEYFFDFLRGHLDGDGTFYSYWDPRWHSSFMFYTVFLSASKKHIDWISSKLYQFLEIKGHIVNNNDLIYSLKFAKNESLKLLPKLYYSDKIIYLSRKYNKIQKALHIENKHNNESKNARVL